MPRNRQPKPIEGRDARAFIHRGPNRDGLWYWKIAYYAHVDGERKRRTRKIGWVARAVAKDKHDTTQP